MFATKCSPHDSFYLGETKILAMQKIDRRIDKIKGIVLMCFMGGDIIFSRKGKLICPRWRLFF
jgi:hypothetical protein